MSILDLTEKIKDSLVILFWPLFLSFNLLILVFLGLIGYELPDQDGVLITQTGAPATLARKVDDVALAEKGSPSSKRAAEGRIDGNFVASKNGTKYYPVTCAGAKRIKEENKVFFATTAEAEASGYSKAKNCK